MDGKGVNQELNLKPPSEGWLLCDGSEVAKTIYSHMPSLLGGMSKFVSRK